MDADELQALIGGLDGVEVVVASEAGGAPESAWGDVFFSLPGRQMPFATIVKSDYPGFDESSQLDRPGVFRVNLAIGRAALRDRFPDATEGSFDHAALDVLLPHPTYAGHGWISVLNPSSCDDEVRSLIALAHERARAASED
jgi:hypothetical protein